ncbi:MAG: tRNA (adenosine(37)-N6)-threonylcarbamoyltransferase complex dimerization subunit type 1 TsaB [Candidatus Saganbacteria bacterium]|nr:tRNA (adenosine(37)-N6)-threonylcarbamoyltransferase complex dimerization subunit type 1 TsaB [Candidatus Saganbacteria bacterium]
MRILGLSSATKVISIGLVDDDRVLAETTVADLRSEKLLFYIEAAGIKPEQIEGIAVAQGPGSYSGLRGGLAAAKTMAQVLNKPLVGLSTLKAIAFNLVDLNGTMAVILDAKRDEYNFALFGASQGRLKRLSDDLVLKRSTMLEQFGRIKGEIHLLGKTDEFRAELKSDNYHFTEEIHSHPYGINVARLGLELINAGRAADPLKLMPNYSHKPTIREWKK